MTKCLMILGADNVGKSTTIANTILSNFDKTVKQKHFVKPEDINDPYRQFYDVLDEDFDEDYFLMDRGFPDTYFYALKRDGLRIPYLPVLDLIDKYQKKFKSFHIQILKRDWNNIEKYHIRELETQKENKYVEATNIFDRQKEYVSYYDFIELFYRSQYPMTTFFYNVTNNLDLIEEYENFRRKKRTETGNLSRI